MIRKRTNWYLSRPEQNIPRIHLSFSTFSFLVRLLPKNIKVCHIPIKSFKIKAIVGFVLADLQVCIWLVAASRLLEVSIYFSFIMTPVAILNAAPKYTNALHSTRTLHLVIILTPVEQHFVIEAGTYLRQAPGRRSNVSVLPKLFPRTLHLINAFQIPLVRFTAPWFFFGVKTFRNTHVNSGAL